MSIPGDWAGNVRGTAAHAKERELKTFSFKCPATETISGTAYFDIKAASEQEARQKLADDASEYFNYFSESDGGTDWDAEEPDDFERI